MSTASSPGRRRLRVVLAMVGAFVFLLGLLTVAQPAAAGASLQTAVVLLGNDYMVVAIIGVLALLIVLGLLVARGRTRIEQTTPPAPEDVHPVPRFGESFDAVVSGGEPPALATPDSQADRDLRDDLREIAIPTVMRAANCTQTEAHERIEAGTWTDNDAAAQFLATSESQSVGARVKAALGGSSPDMDAARETAAAIAALDREARQ